MKIFKLIPSAALALTTFTILEAKSENRVCIQNKGAFSASILVQDVNRTYDYAPTIENPRTQCVDLDALKYQGNTDYYTNFSIKEGSKYKVKGSISWGKVLDCSGWRNRENGDGSLTWVMTGTTLNANCREK